MISVSPGVASRAVGIGGPVVKVFASDHSPYTVSDGAGRTAAGLHPRLVAGVGLQVEVLVVPESSSVPLSSE